jgi:hypothetical protein
MNMKKSKATYAPPSGLRREGQGDSEVIGSVKTFKSSPFSSVLMLSGCHGQCATAHLGSQSLALLRMETAGARHCFPIRYAPELSKDSPLAVRRPLFRDFLQTEPPDQRR